jgi:DNA-binding NarL/FixJ family response regulator
VLEAISADRSATKVVLLTATATDRQLPAAVARGAKGIVLKEAALPEFVECVRRVAAGDLWLPPDVEAALEHGTRCQSVSKRMVESLTCRAANRSKPAWEFPRLCRGGSRSLTFQEVHRRDSEP